MRNVWLFAVLCVPVVAAAQPEFESAPISYETAEARDAVTRLQAELDSGKERLSFHGQRGYLDAVLAALDVPASSQTLVFSKTSLQLRRINPERPRAVYFNDDVYVGYCQHGDVVEVGTVDPQLGAVFWTLEQTEVDAPRFVRDQGQCLSCHASSRTQGVPGWVVRSVYPDEDGHPILGSGTFTTDHRSPFKDRWGGWYVTGTHGAMRHMGNEIATKKPSVTLNVESGANVCDLNGRVNVSSYLRPTSDLVALMVLEHQAQMHNFITLANYETRASLHYDQIMNAALEREREFRSESTTRRITAAGDKLLKYLLFSGEFALTAPVTGMSDFREEFAARGPRDPQGRSLREFDLSTRMFKYPCSYLIYGEQFQSLPPEMSSYVLDRLGRILRGTDESPEFAHLQPADRQAIHEILKTTLPKLPADW